VPAEPLKPAVPIKRSVTAEYIVCLEDGKKFKSLKRHLRTQYALTPDQYRAKWNLPPDYPMVSHNYAQARSQLAKQMGLGQQRRRRRDRG
jgi:predicted transcriptional regulator